MTSPGPGPTEPSDAALARLVAEQRQRDAADARRQLHWARQAASESGSFAGVLLDLAEQHEPVMITTSAGRTVAGRATSIGLDHFAVTAADGRYHLVATAAITAVRTDPGARATVGDRTIRTSATLSEAIRTLAADRTSARLTVVPGHQISGRLMAMGTDVVRVAGPAGTTTYVPIPSVVQVTVG